MPLKSSILFLTFVAIAVLAFTDEVAASETGRNNDRPKVTKLIYYPPSNPPKPRERYARAAESVDGMIIDEEGNYANRRFRRAAVADNDEPNNRLSIQSSKKFGPESHGGWESSARLDHDIWKSDNGNHRVSGYVQHDRIDGGRFGGFRENQGGISYTGRFRRAAVADNDEPNNRLSIQSSKTFGPQSHGGWESSARLEHDFFKSNNGNHRVSGYVQHDRIDGGRFGGFRENQGGISYTGRFP